MPPAPFHGSSKTHIPCVTNLFFAGKSHHSLMLSLTHSLLLGVTVNLMIVYDGYNCNTQISDIIPHKRKLIENERKRTGADGWRIVRIYVLYLILEGFYLSPETDGEHLGSMSPMSVTVTRCVAPQDTLYFC